MSTKLILSRFVYTLLLAVVPYAVFHIVILLQNLIFGSVYDNGALISGYFYSVAFIYIFSEANKNIEGLVKKMFYSSEVNPQEEKTKLTKLLDKNLDIESIINGAKNLLEKVYGTKTCVLVMKENEVLKQYSIITESCEIDNKIGIIQKIEKPVIRDELVYLNGERKELENFFKKLDIQCLIPFTIKENFGWDVFFALGDKRDGSNYSIQDIDYIKSISSVMSAALQRAFLHKQVQDFNDTLKQKVDEQIKDLKEKIEQVNEARRKEHDMLDIMGHELRTPMTIIKNYYVLLPKLLEKMNLDKSNEENSKKYDSYMATMGENIVREIKLINTLLSATKLDDGRLELNLEPVDIIDVVEDGIEGQRKHAEDKQLDINFEKPDNFSDYPKVFADRVRIQEVMDNLLNNAVKYTEKGSVTVRLNKDDKLVKVEVHDTGVGISEDDIKKLGKKFYRSNQYIMEREKSASLVRPGGTGLGLFVTFGLVEAMGGKVDIKSELGKGSVFSYTVPLATEEQLEVKSDKGKFSGNMFERLGLGKKKEGKSNSNAGKSLQELLKEGN